LILAALLRGRDRKDSIDESIGESLESPLAIHPVQCRTASNIEKEFNPRVCCVHSLPTGAAGSRESPFQLCLRNCQGAADVKIVRHKTSMPDMSELVTRVTVVPC